METLSLRVEHAGQVPRANGFEDCLRRCAQCGIGISNAGDPNSVPTFIYRDPLENIPVESRDGARDTLASAHNERNRHSKRQRFGFSTSEDAVTWVVFTHLFRSGLLLGTLRQTGILPIDLLVDDPTLLLWGVPVGSSLRGSAIRMQLNNLCASLAEDTKSFSEPDVIIDLGEAGLIFIEVKYLGRNDRKKAHQCNWSRYESASRLRWRFDDVKASECYELARNWCLLKNLSGERMATLVNLGPPALFLGAEGDRLDRFIAALGLNDGRSRFLKVTWPEFLDGSLDDVPVWFREFCLKKFGEITGLR